MHLVKVGLIILFTFSCVFSATIRVPQDHATIQAGIDAAVNGDTVQVGPGIYTGFGNSNLDLRGARISLISSEGALTTTIDGQNSSGAVGLVISNGEDSTVIVSGFTFTGFNSTFGGAIRCNGSSPKIVGNRFLNNTAIDGGAVYAILGAAKVRDNFFKGNSATRGGAIFIAGFFNEKPEVTGNWIDSCRAEGEGGGLYTNAISTGLEVERNVFSRNTSSAGGAIRLASVNMVSIKNNTFDRNSAGDGGGAVDIANSPNVDIRNNIISGSTAGYGIRFLNSAVESYNCFFQNSPSDCFGQSPNSSDVLSDPLYRMVEPHYYDLLENSPCLDAGDPNPIYNDPDGSRNDIGAYSLAFYYSLGLISPVGDTVITSSVPIFLWHELFDSSFSGSYTYKVFWSDNFSIANADSSVVTTDTSWTSTSVFTPLGKWFWRVRARSESGNEFWSPTVESFSVDFLPTSPSIFLPEDSTEMIPSDWLLWTESVDLDADDTTWYNLQIASSDLFAPVISNMLIREDSLGPNPNVQKGALTGFGIADVTGYELLSDDSYYFWRVKGVDKFSGSSSFSSGRHSFFLNKANTPPLPIPLSLYPKSGEPVNDLTPVLTWVAAFDPDLSDDVARLRYFVQLGVSQNFDGPDIRSYWTPFGQPSIESDSLIDETHYHYRVRTFDDEGAPSSWSSTYDFWTNRRNDFPTNFDLSLPANNRLSVPVSPQFIWKHSDANDPLDSLSYTLVLALDPSFLFNVEFSGIADTSYLLSTPLSHGEDYWWRIRAVDHYDGSTWSSQAFRFRTLVLGDADGNGSISISDAVYLIRFIFGGGPGPSPVQAGDANCNSAISISDVVYLINFIFGGGAAPC